jgi:ADP-heptose:LPS heptosyltransferase
VSRVATGAALAIHPGALGDVLLAIPALRALRAGGARLTLAAQPRIAALIAALGEAEAAQDFDALGLDALFAGQGDARLPAVDRLVCWFGARDPDFARRLSARVPNAIVAPSTSPEREVWEHLLSSVGGRAERRPAGVSDDLIARGHAALAAAGVPPWRRMVVVHPGAGSPAKRWPIAAFVAALAPLTARRDLDIVVHEGPADAEPVTQLVARVPSARHLRQPDLLALAGVLARCAAYIGNDSGVSHLATTVGAPSLALFAKDNLAWRPWSTTARVLLVAMEGSDEDVARARETLEAMLA